MRLFCLAAATALVVAAAGAASAHNLTVTNPQTGEVINQQWIAGPSPLPAEAQGEGLFFHPPSGLNQPAGHSEGLPNACEGTASSPTVTILAPPFFTGCVHGQP